MRAASLKKRAFTLIELLTVLVILSLLAAILYPVFTKAREKARMAACQSNLLNVVAALRIYAADFYGHFPPERPGLPGLASLGLVELSTLRCPTVSASGKLAVYLYRAGLCDDDPAVEPVACDPFRDVHNGGSNFGFVDGHAKWLSDTVLKKVVAGSPPPPLTKGLVDLARRQQVLQGAEQ